MFATIVDALQGGPDTDSEEASHRTQRARQPSVRVTTLDHTNLCS